LLMQGNAQADLLVSPAWAAPPGDILQQACQSHTFFHQSAAVLHCQFHISLTDAKAIVAACPDCQATVQPHSMAVKPRGHRPLKLWQMDVTHVPDFGHLKCVHVSIDCYSMAVWDAAQ
ncbi:PO113 protein, partial [Aegotheles bennettii]|nr:PO113 protein [Aegotheles bennettii]